MYDHYDEIADMLEEWEELDPYGFRDALFDYANNDRDELLETTVADPDGYRNLRAMLEEIREDYAMREEDETN